MHSLRKKRLSYVRTFCGDDGSPHVDARDVLNDLKKFCKIGEHSLIVSPVTRQTDSHAMAYRDGMRDVYWRIMKYLSVTDQELGDYSERAER